MKAAGSEADRRSVAPLLLLALAAAGGCATADAPDPAEDPAASWIAAMDAKPPAERVPDWDATRALMMRKPPRLGEPAPDFALESREGGGTVRLSDFRGKRPVVLVFGSWT